MKLDKFTQKSQEAIFQAQAITQEYSHQAIEPVHLLLALIRQEDGIIPALVTKVAGSVLALQEELQSELDKPPQGAGLKHGHRLGASHGRCAECCRALRQRDAG